MKWIKELNVRLETLKLIEENVRKKLFDMSLVNDFLDMIPKAQAKKAKVNTWDYIKLKGFCTTKETINIMKRQPTEWKKKLQTMYLIIFNTYKELIQLNSKRNQKKSN